MAITLRAPAGTRVAGGTGISRADPELGGGGVHSRDDDDLDADCLLRAQKADENRKLRIRELQTYAHHLDSLEERERWHRRSEAYFNQGLNWGLRISLLIIS